MAPIHDDLVALPSGGQLLQLVPTNVTPRPFASPGEQALRPGETSTEGADSANAS